MAVRKITISLDPELADDIAELAEHAGSSVSAWLADAARRKARQTAARDAFAAYETECRALTPEEKEAGERFWRG
jgi:predicted transcriptional regulator